MSKQKKGSPKGSFIIRSKHSELPEKKDTMRFVSIDPGEKNFAITIQKRGKTVKNLVIAKHIFGDQRKKSGCGSIDLRIDETNSILDQYKKHYKKCDVVLVENQMFVNDVMAYMERDIIHYFRNNYPDICVVSLDNKLKNSIMEKKKNENKSNYQAREISKAVELCNNWSDQKSVDLLYEFLESDDKADKAHDPSVTINQLEAFCRKVGY